MSLSPEKPTTIVTQHIVEANNQFAFALYRRVNGAGQKNLCFSPHSIHVLLTLVTEGAGGNTREEMEGALFLPQDVQRRLALYAGLITDLVAGGKPYQLLTANALFPDTRFEILPAYLKMVREMFRAELMPMDYQQDADGAAASINRWVSAKTKDRIQEIIPGQTLNKDTLLVLVNAVYFKAAWAVPFKESATSDMLFHPSQGESVKTAFMTMLLEEGGSCRYGETDGLQILELNYEGRDLSMVILLPQQGKLAEVENRLTLPAWRGWMQSLTDEAVKIFLPKWKHSFSFSLKQPLAELGIRDAFTEVADFSGISVTEQLVVSDAVHKTFVEVNEAGTEAAAATAVMMARGGMAPPPPPPKVFRADRPFLYAIRQRMTGNILFLGKVERPR